MANNSKLCFIYENPKDQANVEIGGNSFLTFRNEFWRDYIEIFSKEKISQQDFSYLAAQVWNQLSNDIKNAYTVQSQERQKKRKLHQDLEIIPYQGQPSANDELHNEIPLGRKKKTKKEKQSDGKKIQIQKQQNKRKRQTEILENPTLSNIINSFNTVNNVNVTTPDVTFQPTEIPLEENYEYYPFLFNDDFYFPVGINLYNDIANDLQYPIYFFTTDDFTKDIFFGDIAPTFLNNPYHF
ncbi:12268_t:CDS:1 [Funneliformis geosporum]|uniref:6273_t:CDS:1 n=1 Tax=Funneliformis geosporum TaxID=1117311 RepID=A0A9W4SEV1_9GLOM|nr:6273_t:CDS:1 [Funneliformis geosporum]CAI2181333.1 12268_t:CDS:1 [Funneliformis geosporum]